MSVEEAIEIFEKIIKCNEIDESECFSRICKECEFNIDLEKKEEAYRVVLKVLKDDKTPDITKTVNNAIHNVIDDLCANGEDYDFRSYLSGVSILADYILNDKKKGD